jgi:heme exporter protein A
MERTAWTDLSLAVSGWGCVRNGRVLLRELSFELGPGQLLVLKGRNGAGKSTLLRSLAGLMPWRAGRLSWAGQTLQPNAAPYQQQLAYLSHQAGMNDALTALENLRFALALHGQAWNAVHVAQTLATLGLQDLASRPFGRLSQGQRRRLGLARVVLGNRPLWLLDEPDNALDDEGSACLAAILAAHCAVGGLAIVATHRGLALPDDGMRTLDLSRPARAGAAQEAAC